MAVNYKAYFNEHFDQIISIGMNCYSKFLIDGIMRGRDRQTELFDYIGTYVWSINDLIRNDFTNMSNPEDFDMVKFFDKDPAIITNTRYYMIYAHDIKHIEDAKNPVFREKLERRAKRWVQLVTDARRPLFVRFGQRSKIKIPQHSTPRIEREELETFIDLVKTKYKCLNPIVLYVNTEEAGWNQAKTILSLKIQTLDRSLDPSIKDIRVAFDEQDIIGSLNQVVG